MRITVVGASKGTGAEVVRAALAGGHDVVAFSRSGTADVEGEPAALTRLAGDVRDAEAVRRAVVGADAVIVTLGGPAGADDVRSAGTRVVVDAMGAAGVRRLVVLSSIGVGDSWGLLPTVMRRVVVPLFMKKALDDHGVQERVVAASGLDWTVLRPGGLTDGPATGRFVAGFTAGDDVAFRISRADVAAYALAALADATTVGHAISLGIRKG